MNRKQKSTYCENKEQSAEAKTGSRMNHIQFQTLHPPHKQNNPRKNQHFRMKSVDNTKWLAGWPLSTVRLSLIHNPHITN